MLNKIKDHSYKEGILPTTKLKNIHNNISTSISNISRKTQGKEDSIKRRRSPFEIIYEFLEILHEHGSMSKTELFMRVRVNSKTGKDPYELLKRFGIID